MKNKYEIRGDITVIYLKTRKGVILETLIDTADLPRAMEIRTWGTSYDKTTDSYYVVGRVLTGKGSGTRIKLHRWLFGEIKEGIEIDHFNNDTLNNRRSHNLREVTRSQNAQNRRGAQRGSRSGIRGVYRIGERFRAYSMENGKRKHLGYFKNEDDADQAVKEARASYMPYSKEAVYIKNPNMEKYEISPESPRVTNKTSGVKNVHWNKERKKWCVQFRYEGSQKTFGNFADLNDAIEKAKEIRIKILDKKSS